MGVIQRLHEERVAISSVIGCSVGGLIAAFYAAGGYQPSDLFRFGQELSVGNLCRHATNIWLRRRAAAERGAPRRLLALLEPCSFTRLHHGVEALGIVAYDLIRRQPIVFTGRGEHGDVTVVEATTGGAAIPFFFPPKRVQHGDRRYRLVDAGLVAGLPLGAALRPPFAASCVVSVALPGRFWWLRRALHSAPRIQGHMEDRVIHVRPRVQRFGSLLFRRRDMPVIREAGRAAVTDEVLQAIRRHAPPSSETPATLR